MGKVLEAERPDKKCKKDPGQKYSCLGDREVE